MHAAALVECCFCRSPDDIRQGVSSGCWHSSWSVLIVCPRCVSDGLTKSDGFTTTLCATHATAQQLAWAAFRHSLAGSVASLNFRAYGISSNCTCAARLQLCVLSACGRCFCYIQNFYSLRSAGMAQHRERLSVALQVWQLQF